MKLGIAVVYMVSEDNRWLWEIHLSKIRRHTTSVPYTLYAGVTKLAASLRGRLELEPHAVLIAGPATNLIDSPEHSFYLEPLIRQAIADGCTHILTLHMDSFPVRDDWFSLMCSRLSELQPLAIPVNGDHHGQYSACLFFTREFYLRHQPSLLLTSEEKGEPSYQRFARDICHHPDETGVGYLYRAYQVNLSWSRLQCRGLGASAASYGLLCDDLFFHLAGAVWMRGQWTARPWYRKLQGPQIAGMMRIILRHLLPRRWRKKIHGRLLPLAIGSSYHEIRRALQNDPEEFLQALRRSSQ